MDSDPPISSQPTQLLQHALAPTLHCQEYGRDQELVSPMNDSNAANDFSLDSSIIPARPAMPYYQVSLLPEAPRGSRERELAEDSLEEKGQKNEQTRVSSSPPPPKNDPVQSSNSEPFRQHEDSSFSASASKLIATRTRTVSFQSPPITAGAHRLSQPTKSMLVGNKYCRRSRSPSQDSFGGPVSQDPAEQYLASAKPFDIPLSDLGETPTQRVIFSPSHPESPLSEVSSEHKEFLEAATKECDAQRASRAASNGHTKILVAATPSDSSGTSQHKDADLLLQDYGPKFGRQESKFEFDGSSSFDKMLDRDLGDAPDPTLEPPQPQEIQPTQLDHLAGEHQVTDDILAFTPPRTGKQSPPPFEWIAPPPSTAVASSNPRSLLRMVHPNNQYRIARMRYLAGNVEPPSRIAMEAETRPSRSEETQPCHIDESAYSNTPPSTRPLSSPDKMPRSGHQPKKENEYDDEDALDIVPDSEPLRAGLTSQTPDHHRIMMRSPRIKKNCPVTPVSEHGPGDLMAGSLEVEESEVDIPLAVDIAPGIIKRPATPSKEMNGTGKTRGLSSAVFAKVSLPEGQQSRKPTSSSTKVSRPKPSKTEFVEIPTSLPEEDLRGQMLFPVQPSTSRRKKRRSQPLESSRARDDVMTGLRATKLIAGKKRSHNSDTEDSDDLSQQPTNDERDTRTRIQKEEEEETDSGDDHSVGLLPPPPSKDDSSRRKRRRTEDVPTRGTSKTSTSARNKRSETPAIVTRSVKKLRSGVPSTHAFSTEPATRVFALWKQDGHYYSGIVYSQGSKNRYLIKFDDGTEDEVELKNMRHRELLVGDRVIIIQDHIRGVVSDVSHVDSHCSFTLEVDNGQTVTTVQAAFGDIRIANRTIQSQWKARMVAAENIVAVLKPKPPIDATPSKLSIVSTTSSKPQRELVKTGFVVTINPKNEDPVQTKDEIMRAIRQHGGTVIEDWSSVFTMEGKHSQSNKRWIATPEDLRWKSGTKLDRIFLLSDDAHQKPKFLLALALGIPCLSFEWLTKEGRFSSDWQPFLLSAGYSDTLGARVSQRVDLDWGNCTEHLVDIMANRVPIKLFSQKMVLCIGTDLVPPSLRKNAPDEASRYVPWIILCMGAAKVEAVTDTKQVSPGHMQTFDYVIVKERSVLGSVKLGDNIVVGDVNWVKECLVSSRLSDPELD